MLFFTLCRTLFYFTVLHNFYYFFQLKCSLTSGFIYYHNVLILVYDAQTQKHHIYHFKFLVG